MAGPITVYIGLGSNLGDRPEFINKALKLLGGIEQTKLVRASDMIETIPLGDKTQPKFLNAVAEIETTLSADDLHKKLIDIETALGKVPAEKWAPRTIDLDLLLFGDQIIDTSRLAVPHSQMHLRSFVLEGLCQLNAELIHPVIKESVGELAARLNDCDFAFNPDVPQLISIAGIIGVGKTTLTNKLADLFDSKLLFEDYDKNPFLADVYAGKKELALDSQLYFLNSRLQQLDPGALKPSQIVITDYVFEKELIYAKLLLDENQLALYEKVYRQSCLKVIAPVLVIYMMDSPQSCLEKIHNRKRPYEQQIQPQLLEKLVFDYDKLFNGWKTCPVIHLSMSKFDCNNSRDVDNLANQIKSYIAK